jgi:lipoprotein-releasing system permease protein
MKTEAKVAWKYFRLKRKSVVRWSSMIARLSLTFGVAVMMIAQAISRGFTEEIKRNILANTPHINIFRKDGKEIENWESLETKIENIEGVTSVESISYKEAVIVANNKVSYCILQTRSNENKVAIGKDLAKKMGLSAGSTAKLILLEQEEMKSIEIQIEEIIQTGLYDYDSTWIFLKPETFQELLGKKFPNVLKVSVKDVYSSDKISDKIKVVIGEEFEVLDWQKVNQPLFSALALERKVTFAIFLLLVLIASLNIAATLSLLVNERKLDIAVLKTVGIKTKSLILIFLFEGLMLAASGIIIGFLLGLAVCFVVNRFELLNLQKEIYAVSSVQLHLSAIDLGLILISALFLSLISTIYPAFQASRLKPMEILREL